MTKSGQIGANFFSCSGVRVFHLSNFIQETSGESSAPVESLNSLLEEKGIPVPSFSDHTHNCPRMLISRFPVS